MPKSNRKNRAAKVQSNEVSPVAEVIEMPVVVEEETPAVIEESVTVEETENEEETPAVETKSKDALGFGTKTGASYLATLIESGKYTKAEIVAFYNARFAPDEADTGNRKAKKSTYGVFFSDVKRSLITGYYNARSLTIVEDAKTGKLSFEPKTLDRAKEAIGAGLLAELRGASKAKKAAILARYGMPNVA